MTSTKATMEVRVSRRYERLDGAAGCGVQYADNITVWTEFGGWSMPYEAFVTLFGVCIAANTEGVVVDLPIHGSQEQKAAE